MRSNVRSQWKYQAILLIMAAIALTAFSAYAENIDPDSSGCKYAWGESVGWINFKPSQGPGVTVTDTAVTGMAWGENIGWINLSPTSGGVVNDGMGHLSGFAWGENVGWINFRPTGGGVSIGSDGKFIGYAWGENIGWINFSAADTCVKTAWVPAPLDISPDPFSFSPMTGVALNTLVISNMKSISGINTPSPIDSIMGGEYSINGGIFTSVTNTTTFVNSGDTVRVRLTSSGSYSTTTSATLIIGGVSGTFSVTTMPPTPPVVGYANLMLSSYTLSFTDASQVFSSNPTATRPVSVNWGDGAVDKGAPGAFFSHTYPGNVMRTYSVTHLVKDPVNQNLVSTATFAVNVPQRYSLVTTVTTSTGAPINGAQITLRRSGLAVKNATPAGNTVTFTDLLPGTYTVQAYKYNVINVITAPFDIVTTPAVTIKAP